MPSWLWRFLGDCAWSDLMPVKHLCAWKQLALSSPRPQVQLTASAIMFGNYVTRVFRERQEAGTSTSRAGTYIIRQYLDDRFCPAASKTAKDLRKEWAFRHQCPTASATSNAIYPAGWSPPVASEDCALEVVLAAVQH